MALWMAERMKMEEVMLDGLTVLDLQEIVV